MSTRPQITIQHSSWKIRALTGLALTGAVIAAQPVFARDATSYAYAKGGTVTQIEDLHVFSHAAALPSNADPKTVQFHRVKAVKVYTKQKSTADVNYCRTVSIYDTNQSMYCPYTEKVAPARAYKVTYSYIARDAAGGRYSTFHVYFRPEELPPALQRAIANGNLDPAEAAAYFRPSFQRTAVAPPTYITVKVDAVPARQTGALTPKGH